MSVVEWISVGVIVSYGIIVEFCNYLFKFFNMYVLLLWYFCGGMLIEVYWKSVVWFGEGLFVGEFLV